MHITMKNTGGGKTIYRITEVRRKGYETGKLLCFQLCCESDSIRTTRDYHQYKRVMIAGWERDAFHFLSESVVFILFILQLTSFSPASPQPDSTVHRAGYIEPYDLVSAKINSSGLVLAVHPDNWQERSDRPCSG